jgi:hypothetical protein
MNKEFREYIRMLISEIMEESSLPTASQLVSPDSGEAQLDKDKDSEENEELDEFSGVGAIAGFSLPLGMSPDLPVPGSTSRKKSKKRKNPSWA